MPPDPEPPLPVRPPVVEAHLRIVGFQIEDTVDGAGREVHERDAGLHAGDQAAALAEREAADAFWHRPRPARAGGRLQALDRGPVDVDPVERLLALVPARRFSDDEALVDHAAEFGHGGPVADQENSAAIIASIRDFAVS